MKSNKHVLFLEEHFALVKKELHMFIQNLKLPENIKILQLIPIVFSIV